jgi:hypothetical protein
LIPMNRLVKDTRHAWQEGSPKTKEAGLREQL